MVKLNYYNTGRSIGHLYNCVYIVYIYIEKEKEKEREYEYWCKNV